jgi:hypothetical protein
MFEPFEAPKLKIERARAHIQELDVAIRSYFAGKPCVIVVEPETDPQSKKLHEFLSPGREFHAAVARIRTPIPPYLSAIIGDVVHNLRASLDLLICDLARINGKSPKAVYFPFCEKAHDLEAIIKRIKIQGRCGEDIAEFITTIKPYKEGNILLRTIHDLDIVDKHQALTPVIMTTYFTMPKMIGDPSFLNFILATSILKDGDLINSLPAEIPLGTELSAGFFLAFADIRAAPGCRGRGVLEFLHDITECANGIVEAIALLRPGANFPTSHSP